MLLAEPDGDLDGPAEHLGDVDGAGELVTGAVSASSSGGTTDTSAAAAVRLYLGRSPPRKDSAPTVTVWASLEVRISGKTKLFQAKMKASSDTAAIPGLTSGIATLKKACLRV